MDYINDDYCQDCICHETGVKHTETTTTSQCFNPNSVGDGYCDDDTNIELCWFDGGDCCAPDAVKDFCEECACLEEQGKLNFQRF